MKERKNKEANKSINCDRTNACVEHIRPNASAYPSCPKLQPGHSTRYTQALFISFDPQNEHHSFKKIHQLDKYKRLHINKAGVNGTRTHQCQKTTGKVGTTHQRLCIKHQCKWFGPAYNCSHQKNTTSRELNAGTLKIHKKRDISIQVNKKVVNNFHKFVIMNR